MADYVNGKLLLEELKPWLETVNKLKAKGEPQSSFPQLPETVGTAIIQIAEGLGKKAYFAYYTYLDEMIADAALNCVAYIHNFNVEKSKNIFAYLTQIAYNCFIKRIQLEQKHVYKKDKLLTDPAFRAFECDADLERCMTTKQMSSMVRRGPTSMATFGPTQ